MNNYTFNQLDKNCNLSNMQFTKENIENLNYGENSITIKIPSFETNELFVVSFPKGKNGKLFKVIESYGFCASNAIFNIAVNSTFWFHTRIYDVETGKIKTKTKLHYSKLFVLMLNLNKLTINKATELKHHSDKWNWQEIRKCYKNAKQKLEQIKEVNKRLAKEKNKKSTLCIENTSKSLENNCYEPVLNSSEHNIINYNINDNIDEIMRNL